MGEGEREGIGGGLASIGCDGEGRGVGVKVAEGDDVGDAAVEGVGLGVAGRGVGAVIGVKVAGDDGVSVAALEGVALHVAGCRRQSDSSKIAAIAALSLQKPQKGRSQIKNFKKSGVVVALPAGLCPLVPQRAAIGYTLGRGALDRREAKNGA
jgi:hypothetical protein